MGIDVRRGDGRGGYCMCVQLEKDISAVMKGEPGRRNVCVRKYTSSLQRNEE